MKSPKKSPEITQFRRIVKRLLFPLFPGTTFTKGPAYYTSPKGEYKKSVTQIVTPTVLSLRCNKDPKKSVRITRPQAFSKDELGITEVFLECTGRIYDDWNKPYRPDTMASSMTDMVTCALGKNPFIREVVSALSSWSQQTYEGVPISFSIGIDPKATCPDPSIKFYEILDEDFLKVLSNGYDTLLVFSDEGKLAEHCSIGDSDPDQNADKIYCPFRFRHIAAWTDDSNRVAITLNRNGEVLVYKSGRLLFAKRRGDWRYFAHVPVIKHLTKDGLPRKSSPALRTAIYLAALDAAFAKTGACLGVSVASEVVECKKLIIPPERFGADAQDESSKRKTLEIIVAGRKFQEIGRQLRLELLSIDGATVIDTKGNILAIGAILKVSGSATTGGGRQAAAETLAKHGLGIKISNDGYIRIINRKKVTIVEMG